MPSCAAAHRQRGVAAIEFAFVFLVLFLLLYGIATFGAVLYAQQAITRAAEDGARVVSTFHDPTEPQIRSVVLDALGAPLRDATGLTVTAPFGTDPVVVTVTYPYRNNALLPAIPLVGNWMPERLQGRAAAAKPSS